MIDQLLDTLEQTLKAERDAIAGQDVEALLLSTEAKTQALRAVEGCRERPTDLARLEALAAYNRDNGLMMARYRRAVAFALRQLGRGESVGYDPRGYRAHSGWSRAIAVA